MVVGVRKMNDEVQDLINKQTDERLTRVENKIDKIDGRQDNMEKDMIFVRSDLAKLLELTKKSNERWDQLDAQNRSNMNKLKMQFWGTIIAALVTYIIAIIKLG